VIIWKQNKPVRLCGVIASSVIGTHHSKPFEHRFTGVFPSESGDRPPGIASQGNDGPILSLLSAFHELKPIATDVELRFPSSFKQNTRKNQATSGGTLLY